MKQINADYKNKSHLNEIYDAGDQSDDDILFKVNPNYLYITLHHSELFKSIMFAIEEIKDKKEISNNDKIKLFDNVWFTIHRNFYKMKDMV
jgi:hypothetical protein